MFNFFFSLFGGAYLAGKYACEKSRSNNLDSLSKSREENIANISSKHCLYIEEQNALKEYVRDNKNYKQICEEFKEDFTYIFDSDKQRDEFLDTWYEHREWVYYLALSSMGKLDRDFIRSWTELPAYTWNSPYLHDPGNKRAEIIINFAACIDKHLSENGADDVHLVIYYVRGTPPISAHREIMVEGTLYYPHTYMRIKDLREADKTKLAEMQTRTYLYDSVVRPNPPSADDSLSKWHGWLMTVPHPTLIPPAPNNQKRSKS